MPMKKIRDCKEPEDFLPHYRSARTQLLTVIHMMESWKERSPATFTPEDEMDLQEVYHTFSEANARVVECEMLIEFRRLHPD